MQQTRLFLNAFIYMLLISTNTVFLSSGNWLGVCIASFAISFLWCGNVKRISVHTMTERIIYSLGAMLGAIVGLLITKICL